MSLEQFLRGALKDNEEALDTFQKLYEILCMLETPEREQVYTMSVTTNW